MTNKFSNLGKLFYSVNSSVISLIPWVFDALLTLNVLYLNVSFDSDVNFGFITFINDVILDAIERRGVSRYMRLRVHGLGQEDNFIIFFYFYTAFF